MALEEESKKRQLNLGLFNEEEVHRIHTSNEKFVADVMELGYAKLNNSEFMKDLLNTFGPRIQLWLRTSLSRKDVALQAKVAAGKEKLMVDINELLREHMEEIVHIAEQAVMRVLEKKLREAQSSDVES